MSNSTIHPDMALFCFDVLKRKLNGQDPPKPPKFTNEAFPIFVTWQIGPEKKLRGCMGTFGSLNLHSGLQDYALISAFQDPRFDPITNEEFPLLHLKISILTNFEDGNGYLDWTIGLHGIIIKLNNEKGEELSATFLPEVASEKGWDHVKTIDMLLNKAGYKGEITEAVREGIKLTRYQSEKTAASYQDYENKCLSGFF